MKRILLAIALIGSVSACEKSAPKEATDEKTAPVAEAAAVKTPLELALNNLAVFKTLPDDYAAPGQTKAQEDLGRMLFYEKRISKNQDISCNSCHNLATFGVDNNPTSPGNKGVLGGRNSPTVLNAAGHLAQFWDGREPDVEAQAKGPVLNPVEMAMHDGETVVTVLKSIPGYVDAFKAAFPEAEEPITYDNFGVAVGAFERKLVTPSKWDKFLAGDHAALNETELTGLNTFVENGCVACHNGALVGGNSYQKLGAVKPWPNLKDHGRMDLTKAAKDDMVFKVPSLRNIEKTSPYFHDGSVSDLTTAITMMADHQLGKTLTPEQAKDIVAWLGALTGEVDAKYVAEPELPASGPNTPKPDPT